MTFTLALAAWSSGIATDLPPRRLRFIGREIESRLAEQAATECPIVFQPHQLFVLVECHQSAIFDTKPVTDHYIM
jgi:hypothetical protein